LAPALKRLSTFTQMMSSATVVVIGPGGGFPVKQLVRARAGVGALRVASRSVEARAVLSSNDLRSAQTIRGEVT
jgi:hypothetical protein